MQTVDALGVDGDNGQDDCKEASFGSLSGAAFDRKIIDSDKCSFARERNSFSEQPASEARRLLVA
ncbi:MAG: hypothetical protein M3Y57_12505 [Acidobacteriota bacterium]|nr:hypothetical protein [Acidobacteriota bacterium]